MLLENLQPSSQYEGLREVDVLSLRMGIGLKMARSVQKYVTMIITITIKYVKVT